MNLGKFLRTFGIGLTIGYGFVFIVLVLGGNPNHIAIFGKVDIVFPIALLGLSLWRGKK